MPLQYQVDLMLPLHSNGSFQNEETEARSSEAPPEIRSQGYLGQAGWGGVVGGLIGRELMTSFDLRMPTDTSQVCPLH